MILGMPFFYSFFAALDGVSDAQSQPVGPQPAPPAHPVRVLTVDDDTNICTIVATRLKTERGECHNGHVNGWIVECAHSLREALERLSEHTFDVILLDLCLGDSDGIETLERVSRVADGAAIVVMSGLDENKTAPDVMLEGAQDFISKPRLDIRELPHRLCQAIEARRLLERIQARNTLSGDEGTSETCGVFHV